MDNVRYVTSRGESISLLKPPIVINTKQFREFAYETQNGRPSPSKEKTFAVPAALVGTAKQRDEVVDKIIFDSEIKEYGRLYVNDWFVYGNFVGVPSVVAETTMGVRLDWDFYVPNAEWLHETEHQFYPNTASGSDTLNYPFNPPYNYAAQKQAVAQIKNTSATDADFILTFSGNADYVEFGVGDKVYKVESTVDSSETFYLNTYTREVYKIRDGLKADLFPFASDETYIFTKIPRGEQQLYWRGDYGINVTLLERRRFPPWT